MTIFRILEKAGLTVDQNIKLQRQITKKGANIAMQKTNLPDSVKLEVVGFQNQRFGKPFIDRPKLKSVVLTKVCISCGKLSNRQGKGLCDKCYQREIRAVKRMNDQI